jgi:hypothetical protein
LFKISLKVYCQNIMKKLSLYILVSTFILASCGGGDIKVEDEYRELNKVRMKLKDTKRDDFSRKQQENYDIELANVENLREEYVDSLVGTKQSGKCLLDSVKKSEWVDIEDRTSGKLVRSIEVFEKEFTLFQGYTEEQMVQNANNWRVTCREFKQPSDETGFFAQDKRGSKYSFEINDTFLTEEERELLDNIKKGERLSFTGVVYVSSMMMPWGLPTSGLNLFFKNQPWDIGKLETKNTEKTIFFND